LHSAASGGNKEVVELLIAHGAEVNAKVDHIIFFDQSYFTPLHYAAQGGHKEVVEVLLAHGADVTAKSVKGKTPLKLAEEAGHQDIVDLLRQYMKKK
jgi:ankyrin repeat protein